MIKVKESVSDSKMSYTDRLISDPDFELCLWDDEDSNRIIHVDKVDRLDNGKVYKVHVVFADTVSDEHYDEWMYPDELNDLIKDNLRTIKVESSSRSEEKEGSNTLFANVVGKTIWHELYPHLVKIAHQKDIDPNDAVIAVRDWLNMHNKGGDLI